MNIFFLHLDPVICAQMYCDQHMKILLEITQMLFTAFHVLEIDDKWKPILSKHVRSFVSDLDPDRVDDVKIYKPTHIKHPMSIWIRQSKSNFEYAVEIGLQLAVEFIRRYGKYHMCSFYILHFTHYIPSRWEPDITWSYSTLTAMKSIPPNCTPPPICIANKDLICPDRDLVESYRTYYKIEKSTFATWNYSKIPNWINKSHTSSQQDV